MNFEKTISPLLALPRIPKRLIVLGVDAGLCTLTVWLAYFLRLGEWVPLSEDRVFPAIVSIALALPIFMAFGLYRTIFRFAGATAFLTTTKATLAYGLVYAAWFTALSSPGVPRTVGIIQPILLLLAVGSTRALAAYWLGGAYRHSLNSRRRDNILIYGAGSSGRQLFGAIANSVDMRVVGFLDDDPTLQNRTLNGLTIHSPENLLAIVERLKVNDILLAIPSAPRSRRNAIIEKLRNAQVGVRTLPGLMDLARGDVQASDIRELEIEDLLGRDIVAPDPGRMRQNTWGKVVLVTGAGGSIGSELCRQILNERPKILLLVESSEFALYAIHRSLNRRLADMGGEGELPRLVPLLASVDNRERIGKVMATWRPNTVYHAAAYKHVPIVEHNPIEGIRNNAIGTLVVALAAIAHQVDDFVLISTDKAVRPTNIMGASKRFAEMILQALAARQDGTRFVMVRFGNVLGSSGSVVPLFRQQIRDGGPVTITHEEITRYFMTIPEAAQLVIQAGAMAKGGEVFVLDMGEPVRIMDLARKMIELSGLILRNRENPAGDIEIKYIGLRPGEKLYEELLIGNNPQTTAHPRIMKASEAYSSWEMLAPVIQRMEAAIATGNVEQAREILKHIVPEYDSADGNVDWIDIERQAAAGQDGQSSPASLAS
ncbi:nucleoside-diphosphate sugar epimerase/dehydratase [uncultured Sphingomonas sp.]|uniref:polysaccharide biosynthesis protein n=1 Tax=uncultured Sphingomonas sp. TaxID=158754 RepID=UPI002624C6C1|nr:nucleoside-diphosphate sugar epimerase/dehydratase [uncultured Sphingomonas sp.]